MNGRKVKIKDAYKGDAGRGRIRIDPNVIDKLELRTGDVIEISHTVTGEKTAGLLYPGKLEDKGANTVRIDSSLRRNIGASLDDIVEIRKIEASLADRITFAGLEESVTLRRSEQLVRMLENRVITKGDILSFNAMGRRIDFKVVEYVPWADAVKIHLDTKITILDKTYKELEEYELKKVTYEDIGGMSDEIAIIRELIELPLKHPELFRRMGIDPPKGVLLYGLPGTGKTLLARAVAYETGAHFITITGPEIISKYQGKSEENLREIFKEAKQMAPSIIYFDQLDSIFPSRDEYIVSLERRVIAQLLSLLDGLEGRNDIIVMAETSRIDHINAALRRPGRFEKEIEIKPPDTNGRYEILKIHTRGVPLHEDVNLHIIAERTQGFVGADLEALVKEAALFPIREIIPQIKDDSPIPSELLNTLQIKMEHFFTILGRVKPS